MTASAAERGSPHRRDGGAVSVLVVLSLLASAGPLLNDLYLPGFPLIAAQFGVMPTEVQFSLTSAMAGVAIGQLVFGPLSDRFGRRPVLMVGLAVGIVASVSVAIAPSLALVIAARFVQGFGIAAGLAVSRAIAADVPSGVRTMRWLGVISVVAGVCSLIAPLIGGALVSFIGWRAPLWVLAGYLVVVLAFVMGAVPESHQREHRRPVAGANRASLLSVPFLGYTLSLAFGFGAYLAFASASPFIYQRVIGWTSMQFGVVYAAHALLMAGATLTAIRLAARISMPRLLGAGLSAILFAGVCVIIVAARDGSPLLYPFALAFVSIGIGIVIPAAMTLALARARQAAGLGSALLGFLQFSIAAFAAPLVSLGAEPLVTFSFVLAGFAVVALLCFIVVTVTVRHPRHVGNESLTDFSA